jgi:hypothetical protein
LALTCVWLEARSHEPGGAGEDTTTLRVELPDQAALWGLLQRMMDFGLKLIELRLVAVPSATSGDGSAGPGSPVG